MLALLVSLAMAAECAPVEPIPDALQVAWVSRMADSVSGHGWMQVVRSASLQALVAERQGDTAAVLQALGLVGPRSDGDGRWKVTLFDVRREWLCRPMEGAAGALVSGVAVCDRERHGSVRRSARTGCGYLSDVKTQRRTLDIFSIDWATAAAEGFCLLPLPRFLHGRR